MPARRTGWCILIDVGGVIIDEEEGYAARFRCIREALERRGIRADDADFRRAVERSVLSRTPSTHRALAWHYTKPDVTACEEVVAEARSTVRDWSESNAYDSQPGIAEALATLAQSHTLALAGNAPSRIKEVLDSMGVLQYFAHRQVSGDIGLSKPDVRFFLHILREAGAAPEDAVMVGDRLDNDIYPAQLLGMRTIWVRVGPHRILEPREPREFPDCTIDSPSRLVEAVNALTMRSEGSQSPDR